MVKIWKWLKLLNSVPFIRKTPVNHVYIWIWSFWLTFTVLQWMKTNFKFCQFSNFLQLSGYSMKIKIWKWLKLLNSWLTFTVLPWMNTNFKICQFSRFMLRSDYAIHVKIWKWLKLLISVPLIKKTLLNHVYIRIASFWLTFTILQWMKKNSKISEFSSFLLRSGYAIQVKIWKWLKLLNSVKFMKKQV